MKVLFSTFTSCLKNNKRWRKSDDILLKALTVMNQMKKFQSKWDESLLLSCRIVFFFLLIPNI